MKKLLLIITALLTTFISEAATIIVDNINDAGTGSLRQAATDAASGDTIRFNPNLISGSNNTIVLTTGEIAFGAKGIVVKGLYTATDTLFISGNNNSRIFSFNGAGKIVLDSLVLINGNSATSGGAISSIACSDTLHIVNSTFKNNSTNSNGGSVTYSYGAAIYSVSGMMSSSYITVSNSTFSNNMANSNASSVAYSYGAAIYSRGETSSSVSVSNSMFSNNSTNSSAGSVAYSFGATICSDGMMSSSTVSVNNSTFINNSANSNSGIAYSNGGAIYSNGDGGSSVTISTSTFNNNSASAGGTRVGSIVINSMSNTSLTIDNSTFSNTNSSSMGYNTIQLQSMMGGGAIAVGSSIFQDCAIDNGGNSITSNGYNVFTDAPTGTVATDSINIAPASINLEPLDYNGGTTKTLLPGVGSVAINMGDPLDMSDAQNGSLIGGRRDAGAAESPYSPTSSSFSVTANTCPGYTLPSGDSTFTTIGTYTTNDTIDNAYGYDSVMTIAITIISLDQTVNATNLSLCPSNTGTTINTGGSTTGFNYYLRDDANDTIVSGPLAGTGSGLSLNTGTITNNMTYNVYADQLKETAVNFDQSVAENITIPSSPDFDFAQGTIEMWVKPEFNTNENLAIIALRSGNGWGSTRWSLHMNVNQNMIGMYNGWQFQPIFIPSGLNMGQWYHVAVVVNATFTGVYVDGVYQGAVSLGMNTGPTGMNLTIGNNGDPAISVEGFIGAQDDVRIWNTLRTGAEINNFKDECLEGTESGLVALYSFEDGTATDLTGNGHDGTAIGIDLVNDTVTSPQKCFTCGTEMTNTVNITVEDIIDVSTTTNGVTLTANQTGATYQWIDCNNGNTAIINATNASYTATDNGIYAVVITVGNCSDTSDCVTISTVSLDEQADEMNLSLFPNPATSTLTIENEGVKIKTISILDVTGKTVETISENTSIINVSNLNKGIYFLQIHTNKGLISKKFIKE